MNHLLGKMTGKQFVLFILITVLTTIVACKKDKDNDNTVPQNSGYFPSWADIEPDNIITHAYNPGQSETENGAALANAMQALNPGDILKIESGTYSINKYFNLEVSGTAVEPIWIEGEDGVIITRPDANQNIINIGAENAVSYLCIRGIEFIGGSIGVRFYHCENVWFDQCHIHDTQDAGLTANAENTRYIYITQNEINNTGGTGEGMYLGGNNSSVIMSQSIIALNHVHHTNGAGVTQGDGIELKQGSWGNLIAENHVHDCNYPCIIVYGTDGKQQNIVEKNICYNSNDNTMQVQGEAIIRNNLIMNGVASAFASTNHQGTTTNLQLIHNTIINSGRAANFSSWDSKENMVLANNVIYSNNAESIRFPNGSSIVIVEGNVVAGTVSGVIA